MPNTADKKIEDAVKSAQDVAVLVHFDKFYFVFIRNITASPTASKMSMRLSSLVHALRFGAPAMQTHQETAWQYIPPCRVLSPLDHPAASSATLHSRTLPS